MTDTTNAGPVLPELPGQPRMRIALFDEHGNGADDRVLDYGLQCRDAGADSERLKSADAIEQVAGPLREQLAECFNLGGADADGNGTEWRAVHAVRSVRQLRQDYDAACDEAEKLRERVAGLEDRLTTIHGAYSHAELLKQNAEDELARLRAENEALRADLQQRINDEADIRYSGEEQARSGVHELFTGLDDCEIEVPDEWHEKPLLRFIFETDPGDDSVGMPSRSAWSLAKDQSGTVLIDLLSRLLTHEAAVSDSERYRWILDQAHV